MKDRNFKFFESYHLALSNVSDKHYARIIRAMCQYVFEEKTPNFTDGLDITIWELIRPILEKGCQLSEVRREAGKHGKGVSRNPGNTHAAKSSIQNQYKINTKSKQINTDKEKDKDMDKEKDMELFISSFPFDDFWNLYDMKIARPKCEKLWEAMAEPEREACMRYIPMYKQSTPDKTFRKHPDTFLRNRCWEDEIIYPRNKKETLPIGMRLDDNEQSKYNETW